MTGVTKTSSCRTVHSFPSSACVWILKCMAVTNGRHKSWGQVQSWTMRGYWNWQAHGHNDYRRTSHSRRVRFLLSQYLTITSPACNILRFNIFWNTTQYLLLRSVQPIIEELHQQQTEVDRYRMSRYQQSNEDYWVRSVSGVQNLGKPHTPPSLRLQCEVESVISARVTPHTTEWHSACVIALM